MSRLPMNMPASHRRHPPWHRARRRRWVRRDDHLSASAMLALLPSLPRATLSRMADRIIERMDEIDGEGDFETDDG